MSSDLRGEIFPTRVLLWVLAGALALTRVAVAQTPSAKAEWPAFHGGGPLVGVAEAIGAPPMRLRWVYRADQEPPANASKPISGETGAAPSFEGSAAIVNGVAYAADRGGALHAIDLRTGKRKWVYRSEAGFEASPAVLNGVVYIGDEDGTFHAVSADSGKKLWTFDALSGMHSSANFLGGRIVFGTDGAEIFCLNASDGKKLWDVRAGDRVNGAPAIGGVVTNGHPSVYVSGCDAELRVLGFEKGKEIVTRDMGALCPGSPALLGDRLVVGTDGGKVICLSTDAKKQFWEFDGIGQQAMVYSSPAIADNIVVVGARDRNVWGLDLANGQKKWVFATRGDVDSSPVISGGRVYVGSKDKRLYVLDLKSGRKLWDFVGGRGIVASPAIGQGVVIIGDTGGRLYCLEPAG